MSRELTNYYMWEEKIEGKKSKWVKKPKKIKDIYEDLHRFCDGWPKRQGRLIIGEIEDDFVPLFNARSSKHT